MLARLSLIFRKIKISFLMHRCLRCLLLVMCTHSFAKEALTLHLARSEGHERYFGCNLMHRKVLASFHQHLTAEAPPPRLSRSARGRITAEDNDRARAGARCAGLSPADAQDADYNDDERHATDLPSPDRDRNPLTWVSCWARRPRSRRPCAEVPAYKFLESRVLSSFVFLDTTRTRGAPRVLRK